MTIQKFILHVVALSPSLILLFASSEQLHSNIYNYIDGEENQLLVVVVDATILHYYSFVNNYVKDRPLYAGGFKKYSLLQ